MKKIKEMLIVLMFVISVSAVVAPQGHPLSDIILGASPLTLGEALTAPGITSSTFVNANTVTATGKVTAGSIEMNGVLDMKTNKITNLGAPTSDTDAATKKYVDDEINANTPGIIWAKSSTGIVSYKDGPVAIGTDTIPSGVNLNVVGGVKVKPADGITGFNLDTASYTTDWKYGMIIKATRDNTKAFAVTDGTTDKFVVYGNGNANIGDLTVKSITVGNHDEGGGYNSNYPNFNKDTDTCNTVYTICNEGYIAVGVAMTRHPDCGAVAVPICAKN